jgi:hypothetical protein
MMRPLKPCGNCAFMSGKADLTPPMTVNRFALGAT